MAKKKPFTPISQSSPPVNTPKQQAVQPAGVAGRAPYVPTDPQGRTSPYGKPLTGRYTPEQSQAFRADPRNADIISQITQAATTRYGATTDEQVLGLANKVANEGYPIEAVMQQLQAGYGVSDPNLRYVADVVGREFDPQQNQLNRQLEEVARQFGIDVRAQELYGQEANKVTQRAYDALAQELARIQGSTQGIFSSGLGDIKDYYQDATSGVQGAGQDILQQLAQTAQTLGVEQAVPAAQSGIADDVLNYVAQLQGAQAGSLANLNTLGTGEMGIQQRGMANSRQELAQSLARIAQEVQGNIGELTLGRQSEERDIRGQLSDLAGARGSALRTGLLEREELNWQRALEENARRLEEQIQRGTLGIQQGELALQRQELAANLGLRRRELDQQLQIARMNNSTDVARLELEKAALEADIMGLTGSAGSQSQYGATSGMPAVNQFFQTPSFRSAQHGGKPTIAGPEFQRKFNNILAEAFAETQNKPAVPGQPQMDAYTLAQIRVNTLPSTWDKIAMRQAIDIYFGKTGHERVG